MQKETFLQLSNLSDKEICILCRKQRNGEAVRIAISRTAHLHSFDFHVCNKCVRRTSPKIKIIAVAILLMGTILSVILTIIEYDPDLTPAPVSMAAIIALCVLAKQESLNDIRNNLVLDYLTRNIKAEGIGLDVINYKGLRDSRFHRYMPYEWEKIKKKDGEKR